MAAQKQEQHRILRIGIIQGGKILEERLIKAGETVTVGDGDKNTFTLPPSKLPKRFPMFAAKGNKYSLCFVDGIDGRLAVGAQVLALDGLAKSGQAAKKGDHYEYPLTEEHRGKVQVGAATILFQFVTPPPEPARTSLDDLRRFSLDPTDLPFYGILLISALMHAALLIWAHNQPMPDRISLEDVPEKYMRLIIPPKIDLPPEIDLPTDDGGKQATNDDAGKKGPDKAVKPDDKPAVESPAPPSDDERRAALAAKGLAAIIGTRGASGQPNAVADLLSDASGVSNNLDQALSSVAGVQVATRGSDRGGDALRGSNDGVVGGKGVGGGIGGGDVGDGKGEVKLRPKVQPEQPDYFGNPADAKSIRGIVQTQIASLKACYEEQLRGNPDLKGKVVVFFVIQGDGSVGEVRIQESTVGNKDMEECIIRKIRRWKFGKTEDGEDAEVTYPFNFFAS